MAKGKQQAEISEEEALNLLTAYMSSGMTARELKGITPEEMEAVYSVAHNHYTHAKYEDAARIFRTLVLLDMYEPKYKLGYAAALQMQKKFAEALEVYSGMLALDEENPQLLLYAAECVLGLKHKKEASEMLALAIEAAGDKREDKAVKERAEQLARRLSVGSKEGE